MKKIIIFSVLVSMIFSCNTKKQVEQAINKGNYDLAIANALKKLENNKDKKRKQAYVVMLKDAYAKVVLRDIEQITRLKQNNNPEFYKTIYEGYLDLDKRQNAIKRVLPLQIDGKTLHFEFNNYNNAIIDYNFKTSNYLLEESITLLKSEDKYDARNAYELLSYVENINPNFKNVRTLMDEAHLSGIDHIFVSIENETQQFIPQRLEAELLDFNTYGLNQFWTAYHSNFNTSVDYDYSMKLHLQQINISPERIAERQLLRKKDIIDGWEYVLDTNGNVAKDTLGNDIKVDRIITAKARFFEVLQTKSSQVTAEIVFTDLKQNQIIEAFPIESGFVFENTFGHYKGDKRALNQVDRDLLRQDQLLFPSDEQMVYDSGEDLKLQLKNIIASLKLNG